MDILFILPPWSGKIKDDPISAFTPSYPPYGLALLASFVRENGFSTSILDCNALQLRMDEIGKYLPVSAPKFIGITALTPLINNALEIAGIAKEKYNNTKIIIGGVHATFMPKEVLESKYVDYVVRGEGEYAILEILLNKPLETIKGLVFKKNGRFFINPPREMIPDINVLPFPAYDLLPMEKYSYGRIIQRKKFDPCSMMITSRGCPGRCAYCSGNFLGNKIRFRSAEKIIEEITILSKNHGVKSIEFLDSNFITDRKRIKEFCNLILKNNLNINWACQSRADMVDLESLKEMKKAGCERAWYGLDSAEPKILENMRRTVPPQKVKEAIALTKKAGIRSQITFMIGFPGETEENIKKTIRYAFSLGADEIITFICTPYPGTEIFYWAEKNNFLLHKNWSEYDASTPVMKLSTISSEKLREYYKKSYRQYFLRPRFFLRIKDVRGTGDFKIIFQFIVNMIKKVFFGK